MEESLAGGKADIVTITDDFESQQQIRADDIVAVRKEVESVSAKYGLGQEF